jgi:hypothetical protein
MNTSKKIIQSGGGGKMKASVLKVEIFKRKGSRYWQARIVFDKILKRISTRTIIKAAAEEFAVLAFKHYSRLHREGKL